MKHILKFCETPWLSPWLLVSRETRCDSYGYCCGVVDIISIIDPYVEKSRISLTDDLSNVENCRMIRKFTEKATRVLIKQKILEAR